MAKSDNPERKTSSILTLVWFEEPRRKNWKLIRVNFAEVQKRERGDIESTRPQVSISR